MTESASTQDAAEPDTGPDPDAGPDVWVAELMLSEAGRRDPAPWYRMLREQAPVHRSAMAPVTFCTRYEDCKAVLRDPRFGKGEARAMGDSAGDGFFGPPVPGPEDRGRARSMLFLDPPDHTRLRGLVSRGFTPRRVEQLRPSVEAMTDALLDEWATVGEADVLDVLGFPLPVQVIGELVGVPPEDRAAFRTIVRDAAAALEPGLTEEQVTAAMAADEQLTSYFGELIDARHADPRDDLASALTAVKDEDDDRLTKEEMVSTLILIFAAGFETTTNLIGNGLVTLLRHPEELERLRADPSLMPAAVEELLRFESPVQVDGRTALTDADVAGQAVAEGEFVVTFLGAANRDPEVFDDPETFSIVERDTSVLSFATGIHYCLGAALARLEGQVVFGRILDRFEQLELLDDPPEWRSTLVLRGLQHLHVRAA